MPQAQKVLMHHNALVQQVHDARDLHVQTAPSARLAAH